MMEALVSKGPLAVAFNVEDDFHNYNGGIYSHVSSVKSDFDPLYVSTYDVYFDTLKMELAAIYR